MSLLCSLSKILEKIVFIRLYNFLLEIGYLNRLQSGFRPGDSTVNQLIYLVHQIYQAVEDGKEVRMVFWISARRLKRCGTKVFFISLNQ